jgi:hypothetical protein
MKTILNILKKYQRFFKGFTSVIALICIFDWFIAPSLTMANSKVNFVGFLLGSFMMVIFGVLLWESIFGENDNNENENNENENETTWQDQKHGMTSTNPTEDNQKQTENNNN